METVNIEKQKNKSVFSAIFNGKKTKSNKSITERVKTFEDACDELGIEPNDFFTGEVCNELHGDIKSIVAYAQMIIICRALNEGWTPDWNNEIQYKYSPYFKMKAGFGFSYTDCATWRTSTTVCSRLCFKTRELAEYAGTQFETIYNDFLNH